MILGMFFVTGCADNGASEEPVPSTPAEGVDEEEIAGTGENVTGAGAEIVDVEIRGYKYDTPEPYC